ncbi:MAG: PE family protein [Mycobacterium sp.]|uniref:PE family protein n=1 Tax=Mycobacterium sp. TaxID=1785 RepID=UPI001ED72C0D|nr:PE family protein [Mycobacterium sp.]MBW0019388.1 PE family protein [Mycobacterium sp.]
MSYVIAAPEYVAAAATDLMNIGSAIGNANSAATAPITGVMAPGADEVSAMLTALFASQAQAYQALSAQAAMFHDQFVQLMNTAGSQYALTEATNASPLQTVEQGVMTGVSAPVQALTGNQQAGTGASAVAAAPASAIYPPGDRLVGVTGALGPAANVGTGAASAASGLPTGGYLVAGGITGGNGGGPTVASAASFGTGDGAGLGAGGGLAAESEVAQQAALAPAVTPLSAAPAATTSPTASGHSEGTTAPTGTARERQAAT